VNYKVEAWSWCADYCKKNQWNPHDSYFWNKANLEYRRQHNIFEVGDKVVIRKADGHPDLFTYESISKSGNMHFFESPFNYGRLDLCKVRHANDAEIKADKRLEVK
jgi:hypothetical protein